tara:strand:- start:682 stop:981 length:300 start_codon:yes stop_codon:yes gene_type:complete
MALNFQTIDAEDIERFQKQSIRSDIQYDLSSVINTENPLAGVTSEQRNRNSKAGDVLNIGSGTRCQHCGMLHFLWRENCGACNKPMEYNLGHRDEENRD